MTIFAKKISGKVQGIGFRATATRIATEMYLNGYVRNLPTGEVELVVEASEKQFESLVKNIRQAIPGLRIDAIEDIPPPKSLNTGFTME